MTRILFHGLSALVALALILVFVSSKADANRNRHLEVASITVGTTQAELLRVCINGLPSQSSDTTETGSIMDVFDASGSLLLERELVAPFAGFQCIDLTYEELVAAGLEPDPTTGAVTYRTDLTRSSEGGARSPAITGAIMNVGVTSGMIHLYQDLVIPN
jgi:hypothetical protein